MKETDPNQIYVHTLNFTPVKTRYVKVKALSERVFQHGMVEKVIRDTYL